MRIVMLTRSFSLGSPPPQRRRRTRTATSDFVKNYEGTQTCLKCHEEEAENFFHTQHYQWRGATPDLVNSGGQELGKLSMVNDFCTNPDRSAVDRQGKKCRGQDAGQGLFILSLRSGQAAGSGDQPGTAGEHGLPDMPCVRLSPGPLSNRGWRLGVETDPVEEPGGSELGGQADPDPGSHDVSALPLRFGRRAKLQAWRYRVHAKRPAAGLRRAYGVGW